MPDRLVYGKSLSFTSKEHGRIKVDWAVFRRESIFGHKAEPYPFGKIESVTFESTGQRVDEYDSPDVFAAARAAVDAAYSLYRLKLIDSELRGMLDSGLHSELVTILKRLEASGCGKGFAEDVKAEIGHRLEMLRTMSERGAENIEIA